MVPFLRRMPDSVSALAVLTLFAVLVGLSFQGAMSLLHSAGVQALWLRIAAWSAAGVGCAVAWLMHGRRYPERATSHLRRACVFIGLSLLGPWAFLFGLSN